MVRILHICNDFLGSKVYRNLYERLANLNYDQTIFCPLRTSTFSKLNKFSENDYQVFYSERLSILHKLFFHRKIKFLLSSLLQKNLNISDFNIVCATTLFSDGALAYELFLRFGIPYIVTVRSVDTDLFLKFRPDLQKYIFKVLLNSSKIIFISDALKNKFYLHPKFSIFKSKSVVIYNGINPFWFENIFSNFSEKSKFLFVGRLINEKNLKRLLEAFSISIKKYPNLSLTIVGDGPLKKLVEKYEKKYNQNIKFHGLVNDKVLLKEIYRSNKVFIMPSKIETFGLTYLEALSQGQFLIYSKGNGIDGVFSRLYGISVDSNSINSICNAIEFTQIENINFDPNSVNWDSFNWDFIAKVYDDLYKKEILF